MKNSSMVNIKPVLMKDVMVTITKDPVATEDYYFITIYNEIYGHIHINEVAQFYGMKL